MHSYRPYFKYRFYQQESQYEFDLHIKRGIKAEELIRVYFCWSDNMQKIMIGSMSAHLATVKNGA